jgi:hypothetical protein
MLNADVIDPRWVKSWPSCKACLAKCGWPEPPSTYVWKDFPHDLNDTDESVFERYSTFYNNDCDPNSTDV